MFIFAHKKDFFIILLKCGLTSFNFEYLDEIGFCLDYIQFSGSCLYNPKPS